MDRTTNKEDFLTKELSVGLFFYITKAGGGKFYFSGCSLSEAEKYGDFLIYPESHYDIWDREVIREMRLSKRNPYDYFPRGRVVYSIPDNTFVIYYDKCIEKEIIQIADKYAGERFRLELDEHYCCHRCNRIYIV